MPYVIKAETSFIIQFVTLLPRRLSLDLIIVNTTNQRSRSSLTPKHISDSFPTVSIYFASMYILSTCLLSTLPSDLRNIAVAFFIFIFYVFIYMYLL